MVVGGGGLLWLVVVGVGGCWWVMVGGFLLRTLPNNKYYDTLESEGVSLSYPLNMYLKGRKLGGIKLGG